MFELTWLVLDFLIAIIFFLASIVIIPSLCEKLGLKLIFKIEKLSSKDWIKIFENDIKLGETRKKFIEGGK